MKRVLVGLGAILLAFGGGVGVALAQSFVDSPIVTVTTLPPGGAAKWYTFICRATSDTSISLVWVGSDDKAHSLKVLGGSSISTLTELAAKSAGSGSYELEKNLAPGTTRYYQLKIDYNAANLTDVLVPAEPASCTTLAEIPQDPASLKVAPLGPSSLYVTWKDNATRAHNFVLERIKVTPATSTAVTATPSGASNVRVVWTNPTNIQTFRSPYYHVVERSADASFSSITSFPVSFVDDMRYTGTKVSYEFTDVNAPSGVSKYYRVKACSLLKVDYDGNGSLDDVCTAPTPANDGQPVAAVTTPLPGASIFSIVKDAAVQAVEEVGGFFGRLAGRVGAVGFAGIADGAQVDLNTYFAQFRTGENNVPSLTFATNPGVYRDNNLAPDSVYLYRTKTCYLNANGTTNVSDCTSYTNEGAGKTLTSAATSVVNVNVCVRNNLCGPVSGFGGGSGNAPVNQCTNNAACRNVGTTRQFFEER